MKISQICDYYYQGLSDFYRQWLLSNSLELLGPQNKTDKDINYLNENVVLHIKNKKLSHRQLNMLADALSESISEEVFEETVHLRGAYEDPENTSTLNLFTYLTQKPPVLTHFSCAAMTYDF